VTVAGSVLGGAAAVFFDAAGTWVAEGAVWLLGQVGHALSATSSVDLGAGWFTGHERVMATIAAAVVLPMACCATILAVYRQDASMLMRTFLVQLPLALLLTGVAVELVRLSLAITDNLSAQVLAAGGVDTEHLLAPVAAFLLSTGPVLPAFVLFVGALLVAFASMLLWLKLVVRSTAITAATLFLPLALAGLVWPAVSHWCRRLAETIAALVLSKLVIAAVLSLAAGALASGSGFGTVVVGISLLIVATTAPFTLLRLVPAVEAGAVGHLESSRRRLGTAATAPLRAGGFARDVVSDARKRQADREAAEASAQAPAGVELAPSRQGQPNPPRRLGPRAGSTCRMTPSSRSGGTTAGRTRRRARLRAQTAGRTGPARRTTRRTVVARDEPARYRFGPLERRGVVAGWRGGQLGAVAGSLVVAVLVLRVTPSLPGIAGAVLVVAVAVAASTWPMAGRTAEEWAPDAVRYACASGARRARRRRGLFSTLELLPVAVGHQDVEVAVLHDVATRRYTCVLRASGAGFVLAGEQDQETRIARWASVLSSLARQGSSVHRLQWVARSLPDDGTEVRRHLESAAVLGGDHAAYRSYRALLELEQASAHVHEVLVSVTVDAGRAGRAVRAAGGGDAGACAVLLREAASVRRLLADAGIEAGDLLSPGALAGAVRRGFEGAASPRRPGRVDLASPPTRTSESRASHALTRWPWPMTVDAGWSQAHVDGTWHATYWVAEWPRRDVGPDFLGPLLVSDVRRTVALVMEPMGALQAARRVEQARTADIADAELRRRGGFLATARRHREEEVLVTRERELADGHAQYRFAGYVTVSAADSELLEDACARTEHAAGRAGLELRRCYGDQDRAFACTLPLGRGLP
jgi:hypothetical protein